MTRPAVALDAGQPVATLTLDRVERHNAIDFELFVDLERALKQALGNPVTRVIVLASSVERVFSTGADMTALLELGPTEARRFANKGVEVINMIMDATVPTIAAVDGLALGGGWELALACDLIYASERATFSLPEVRMGLVPTFGSTRRLESLVGPMRMRELVWTARAVRADAARELGLVLDVVPHEELLPFCRSVAERVAQMSSVALAHLKRTLRPRTPTQQEAQDDAEVVFASLMMRYAFRGGPQSEQRRRESVRPPPT